MISVSFLKIKENLKEKLEYLDKLDISFHHLDIMDGKFTLNKTWDAFDLIDITKYLTKPLDVHLMVEDINKYIEDFSKLNPKYITFHLEACKNIEDAIKFIHDKNIKVGISIKPNTDIEKLKPFLDKIDLVLVMSVEPGNGGQTFINSSLERIEYLNNYRKNNNLNYLIEVDGGINPETKALCKLNGADIFVVGSYITDSNNFEEKIELLHAE